MKLGHRMFQVIEILKTNKYCKLLPFSFNTTIPKWPYFRFFVKFPSVKLSNFYAHMNLVNKLIEYGLLEKSCGHLFFVILKNSI